MVLLLAIVVTGLAATLLVGRRPGVGRILFSVSDTHGVHVGDIPVLVLWAIGLVCTALLWRDRSP